MTELRDNHHFIWVDYTNWKGVRGWRRCIPLDVTCGIVSHHGEDAHWCLNVLMEDKEFARRSLILSKIHQFKDGGPSPLSYGRPLA